MNEELETIFSGEEAEATEIRSVLDASGIDSVLVGDSVLPNLGFEVRVSSDRAEDARRVLEQALETGAAGAEEAERQGEAEQQTD
jgi:hypothetical protein